MTLIENKLPRLNEILGPEQQAERNDAILLLRLPNDFVIVQHGAVATRMMGTNLTGTLLSEQNNAVAHAVQKVYMSCVDSAEPFYIRYVAAVSPHEHFFLEQIALPIAADERRDVGFVLVYNAPLDGKNEVLKAIFDRSHIGMIAAASNQDEASTLQDARILLINARARAILKLPEAMDRIHTVRDLGVWFQVGARLTKTNVVSEDGQRHFHYRDQQTGMSYRLTVEPIDRFVLFSLIEVPQI
jgi:hypothetical protein